jgi:hypothetical protein
MIEFDVDKCTDPVELAGRTGAAIIDARAWLLLQQETSGIKAVWSDRSPGDVRSLTESVWPSFKLDLRTSSRYFGFARVNGEICIYARANCKAAAQNKLIADPMAWFALIPWQVMPVRMKEGYGIRLICPEFELKYIKVNSWSLLLRLHGDLLPLLSKTSRVITLRCDSHYISGWDVELITTNKKE